MTPDTDIERLAKELVDHAAEGCCQNGMWRGRLCSYHEGFRDEVEEIIDRAPAPTEPHQSDGGDPDG